jgi:hypothetical protein
MPHTDTHTDTLHLRLLVAVCVWCCCVWRTGAQNTISSTLSVEAYSVAFNYMLNAWVVDFGGDTVLDGVAFVQVCEPQHPPANGAPAPTDLCAVTHTAVTSSVVLCANVHNTLHDTTQAAWVNTMLTAHSNDILCSDSSVAVKQAHFAQSHDWLYVTTPLQIVLPYRGSELAQYALSTVDNTYTVNVRLCVVQFTGTDNSIVSLSIFEMPLHLHEPAELASESAVQNVCVRRGLRTPRHGMLVPSVSELGDNICTVRCNWRFLRVPWNAAAAMLPAANATDARLSAPSACIPIPPTFSAVTMHIQLDIAPGATSLMLPLSTLAAVDDLALTLQQHMNSSQDIVVCRVPHSLTQGPPFEFVLHKFATETADGRLQYEVRQRTLPVVDDSIYAECLFLLPSIMEPHNAVAGAVHAFRRSLPGQLPGQLPASVQALGLGDADVREVSRLAQVVVPKAPRIPLSVQRMALFAVEGVFVLTSILSVYMRS